MNDAEVTYTVKELLTDLNRKIDGFMTLLASKADTSAVEHLASRVDVHDERLRTLESHDQHVELTRDWKRWAIPTLISLAATIAIIVSVVVHP